MTNLINGGFISYSIIVNNFDIGGVRGSKAEYYLFIKIFILIWLRTIRLLFLSGFLYYTETENILPQKMFFYGKSILL